MATFNINELVPQDFMLGMSDDGALDLGAAPAPAGEVASNEKPAAGEPATDNTGKASGDPAVVATPDPAGAEPKVDWEKRYKDLQADHTRSRQELSESRTSLSELKGEVNALKDLVAGKTQTPSTATDEDLLDALSDRERAPGALKKFVADTLREVLGPETIERNTQETSIQRELRTVSERYTDFPDQVPVIRQLNSELSSRGIILSFEQLYQMSKMLPKAEAPAKTEAAASKAQAGLTESKAAEIKAKADGLKTESGVSADPSTKRVVNNVKSALAEAMEELGYQ
jgi:uncharacterized phage infection (PIP) family protein YhgE